MKLAYHCENDEEHKLIKDITLAVASKKKYILETTKLMSKVGNLNNFPHIITTANVNIGDRSYVMISLKQTK